MANFPNSVTTFTNRSAGQAIQPAHVNDLQNEVNAIEDGYLNGTARLNSSNSTVANLSVTNGSTFAGSVTFSSATFSNAVTFSSLVTFSGQPRCQLREDSTQSIASAAFTDVTFNIEDIDVGGLHSTTTNPSRITVPAGSSGDFYFWGKVDFGLAGGNPLFLRLLKNGASAHATVTQMGNSSHGLTVQVQHMTFMDGGDFITLQAQQNSGSTMSIGVSEPSLFGCRRIG